MIAFYGRQLFRVCVVFFPIIAIVVRQKAYIINLWKFAYKSPIHTHTISYNTTCTAFLPRTINACDNRMRKEILSIHFYTDNTYN